MVLPELVFDKMAALVSEIMDDSLYTRTIFHTRSHIPLTLISLPTALVPSFLSMPLGDSSLPLNVGVMIYEATPTRFSKFLIGEMTVAVPCDSRWDVHTRIDLD
jgi:hypothetical protein